MVVNQSPDPAAETVRWFLDIFELNGVPAAKSESIPTAHEMPAPPLAVS